MNKEVISDKQGICLVILFIAGETLAMQTAPAAGSDLWLAILLAIVTSIPLLLVYSRILSLFHGKGLFDILECLFGRILGKFLSLIFVLYIVYTGTWVLRDFSEYPVTVSSPETPKIIFTLIMIILCVWGVKGGLETLGRWANLFVIIDGPLPTIAILSLIPLMDMSNIQPILYNGLKPLLHGTYQAFAFPFAETVVFLTVLSSLKTKTSSYAIYIKGLLWGGLLVAGVSLAEILVLGPELYGSVFFPNHTVAAKVNIGENFQRMEIITIIAIVTSIYIKLCVYLLGTCNGIAKILGLKDYKIVALPVGLLMCNFTLFGDVSIIKLFQLVEEVWPYFAFPFQVIFPIFVLIVAEIKTRRRKNSNKKIG